MIQANTLLLPSGISESDIRVQLERILESEAFKHSARQGRFLTYIIEQTLSGKLDRLKGYSIGVDVFDKDETFDPGTDSIVRVEAGRLRTKLKEYYRDHIDDAPVIIELPKGTYAPKIFAAISESKVVEKADLLSPSVPENSIAVLPFRNLSPDPEQDYLGNAMTDVIITALAQYQSLKVISMTSVMRYRNTEKPISEIAEDLGVRYILEGTVLHIAGQIRITGQLIESSSDHHIWAKSYERELSGIFKMQREIAQDIAEMIASRISLQKHEPVKVHIHPEAYEVYLQGRRYRSSLTRDGFYKAAQCFEKAIDMQPDYAGAYAALASCYCALGSYGFELEKPASIIPKGLKYSHKAIELDPGLVDCHTYTAIMTLKYEWDWPKAKQLFQKALEVSPNDARAHLQFSLYYESLSDHESAIREAEMARSVDPLSVEVNLNLVWQLHQAGRDQDAWARLYWTRDLNPDFWGVYWCVGHLFLKAEKYEKAVDAFRHALDTKGGNIIPYQGLGYAYARNGQEQEANSVIEHLKEISKTSYVSPYYFAVIYAGLNNLDECFDWLEKAYEARARSLAWIKVAKEFKNLHTDKRFKNLLKRIDIPEA